MSRFDGKALELSRQAMALFFEPMPEVQLQAKLQNLFISAMEYAAPVTAATVPDGWKLVPVEPTEAMLDAAYSHPASTEDRMRKQYASMLAAAPAAPEQEV